MCNAVQYMEPNMQCTNIPFLTCVPLVVNHPQFIANDGVCLNKRLHASLHDGRPGVAETCMDWHRKSLTWYGKLLIDKLPEVGKMQNPNLVVWDTAGELTSSCMWVPNGTCVTTARWDGIYRGWIAPPDHKIQPNRTLVGNYSFYTSWFVGNYGHFLHDHLPSMAYLRRMAMDKYGDNAKFILVDFGRYKELVNFTDPDFYKRVEWIKIGEVIRIEGEVTYLKPNVIPDRWGGHALMTYLRDWMVEVHPFDQADFDANKHVIFYNRTGTADYRILDGEHEKQVVASIRAAMERNGLGDQEIFVFSGHDKNGVLLSMEEQFRIFRRASTIIGPHGSGISNMFWTNPNPKGCEARTKVLEFVPGPDTAFVHAIYHGYYDMFKTLPLDYHQIFYQLPSTHETTFINITTLEKALDVMWGGNETISVSFYL